MTAPVKLRLTVAEAAEYLAVSLSSIYTLLAAGKLERYQVLPGRSVIDRVELDRYLDSVRVPRGKSPKTPHLGPRRGRPRKSAAQPP